MFRLVTLVRNLFRSKQQERDLEDEISGYLALLAGEKVAKGMRAEWAEREARLELGGIEQLKEGVREVRVGATLEQLWKDLSYALRSVRKRPLFAILAALTLALGVGVNTAMFSFAKLMLRQPVSLADLDRLIALEQRRTASGEAELLSFANYLDLKSACRSTDRLAAYTYWNAAATRGPKTEAVQGAQTTEDFFETLAASPERGRVFSSDEALPGKNHVLVISRGAWKRWFGEDSQVLGRTVTLNGEAYTVVGVMPAKFNFPLGDVEFWTPLPVGPKERNARSGGDLEVIGHLRPGITLDAARAEYNTVWTRLQRLDPVVNSNRIVAAVSLRDHIVNEDSRQFISFLLSVVGFVLLIACLNVATMQVARVAARQPEFALRRALGAGRRRIFQQALAESVLLSSLSTVFGLVFAAIGVKVLKVTIPADVQRICDMSTFQLDAKALVFALSAAALSAILAGLAPAWQSSRIDPGLALKENSARVAGSSGSRFRNAFVFAELALSIVLVIGASLMVHGLARITNQPGFDPSSLLAASIKLPKPNPRGPYTSQLVADGALVRVRLLPGVQSVALISGLPYTFYENDTAVLVQGQTQRRGAETPQAMRESISADYFRTMRISARSGRVFDDGDGRDTPRVAIVSESMAHRFWPGQDAVGRRLMLARGDSPAASVTVVGVVADVRHEVYDRSARSIVYVPYPQDPPDGFDLAIRMFPGRMPPISSIRSEILALNRDVQVTHIEPFAERIAGQSAGLRWIAGMMAALGGLATMLSSIGVYGVVSHSTSARKHEFGIRMAVGASKLSILQTAVARTLTLTGAALGVGVLLSFGLGRLLTSFFYGVNVWDTSSFAGAYLVLFFVSFIASIVPAHRATGVDVAEVLRYQ